MPSLKTFRLRIRSVQSTQKITKAMKMVAAAKLRRAQEQALAARPYAEAMDKILASLGASFKGGTGPRLLAGTGSDKVHLLIVATADRGLCGAFKARSCARRADIRAFEGEARRKVSGWPQGPRPARSDYGRLIVETITDSAATSASACQKVAERLREMFPQANDVASVSSTASSRRCPDRQRPQSFRRRRPKKARRDARQHRRAIYESSPTRPTFWPTCCRAISRCRSIACCWRMRRASTARR